MVSASSSRGAVLVPRLGDDGDSGMGGNYTREVAEAEPPCKVVA